MKLSDLLVPSTKFSKFRCDTYKKFSASAGILYPVWFNLLNPGESASMDLRTVIRSWPTESPLMGSCKVRFVTAAFNLKNYAMALEGYNRKFDWKSVQLPQWKFVYRPSWTQMDYFTNVSLSEAQAGSFGRVDLADSRVNINFVNYLGVADCSLADYLGYPTGWLPTSTLYGSETDSSGRVRVAKSFLPFLCYYDFYRNYLINPQEERFPIFVSGPSIKDFPDPASLTDGTSPALVNDSLLSMIPVTILDDFISYVHKLYDGSSSGDLYINSSNFVNQFVDFFSWTSDIGLYTSSNVLVQPGNIVSSTHGGLVSTMYDSDINTNWMSVDNYSKLNDVKVNTQTVSGSTFSTFSDIVKASSLWDFVTKSVNSDGTYGDFIGNQFGVTVKGDMNVPQIVHVYDTLLTFDDITSQSDTVVSPDSQIGAVVGQQFGVGRSYGQSNRFKVVNKDGNYVMLMTFMWITPQVCYAHGLHHLNNITSFADLYQPSFDNYAMQGRLQEQVNCYVPTYDTISERYSTYEVKTNANNPLYLPLISSNALQASANLGYQPAWSDYKTDVDVVHGLFRSKLDYYTIIRDVPRLSDNIIVGPNDVASTYVWFNPGLTPTLAEFCKTFSLPFQIDTEDPFQVQLRVGCTITRAMSKNVNPNVK